MPKMELDRTYNEEEQRRKLLYGIGVEARGKRRTGQPKTTQRRMVEDERQAAGWQSWMTVRAYLNKLKWIERQCQSLTCMCLRV